MIRLEPIPDDAPAADEPAACSSQDLVVVSGALLEQVVAVLAPAADFAGSDRAIGRFDTETLHPHLPLSVYRRAREVRHLLMQELAANV
jgi:hypothetical protein